MKDCPESPNKKHMYEMLSNLKFEKDYTSYIGCYPTEYIIISLRCTECHKRIDGIKLSTEMLIEKLLDTKGLSDRLEIDSVWWKS